MNKIEFTGVEVVDNTIALILGIFAGVLIVVAGSRFIKMFFRHEYAQIVASLIIFGLVFIFIYDPQMVINIFKGGADDIERLVNVPSGGSGGPAN